MSTVIPFYLNKEEPNKNCLLALRDIILNHDQHITATKKYGMPCFCYQGKAFCYLWVDKKSDWPYLLLVEGNRLHHPDLERGDRARMKVLNINPNQDIPISAIKSILSEALDLYKNPNSPTN